MSQVKHMLVAIILGFMAGSFAFWRRLREELADDQLLEFPVLVLLVSLVGLKLAGFLGAVGAGGVGVWVLVKRFGWKFWDVSDALVYALLCGVLFGGAGLIFSAGLGGLAVAIVAGISLLFGLWVRKNFKSWAWYKSGRIGIVGILEMVVFLPMVLVVAFFPFGRLYLVPFVTDSVLVLVVLVVLLVVLYRRADRTITEDLPWLKRR